ncbi:TerB N-terminal domain-containing protein [Deinococcus marmoris]|uniref:TerB N-terminal domain-containing protein n=1 Tax=Deinococcus marmoris TaxID=249408 RepID=UPI000497B36E|nr:TerB N-terminal domain-containing protein [Deinococcus marmoris]
MDPRPGVRREILGLLEKRRRQVEATASSQTALDGSVDPFEDLCLALHDVLEKLGQRMEQAAALLTAEGAELQKVPLDLQRPQSGSFLTSVPLIAPEAPANVMARVSPVRRVRWEIVQYDRAYPGEFLEEARRRVNETRKQAQPVPLQAYWTSYHVLDHAQENWYFFWRARFRAGEALPTELSYLFLHAYEVLHGVGFPHPEAAFAHLRQLWYSYRETHPKLDDYLLAWLTDFVHYYELDDQTAQAWREEVQAHGRADLTVTSWEDRGNLMIQSWLEGDNRDHVPKEMFRQLITYVPGSNKFYREAQDQAALDALFGRAIALTDDFYRQTSGKSVFERLGPKKAAQIKRQAFVGAVFEGPHLSYTVGTVRRYRRDGKLSKLLTQAVRYAENLARKQTGFKTLLREIALPAELKTYLDAHLIPGLGVLHTPAAHPPAVPERPRVQLDPERLAALQQESDEIRERLLEESLTGEAPVGGSAPALLLFKVQPVVPAEPPSVAPALSRRPPLPAELPEGHLTDVNGVAEVLYTASEAGCDLLRQLGSHGWELAERDLRLPPGTFASTLIDEVNEAAQLRLGDVLLLQEDGVLIAVEDYRAQLEFLLPSPGQTATAPAVILEEPWQALAGALPSIHLELLDHLLQADLTVPELEAFTAARHAFASVVLEDLNAHALDTVGDILVDPYGDPLTLEDAYRDNVRRVLQARGLIRPE